MRRRTSLIRRVTAGVLAALLVVGMVPMEFSGLGTTSVSANDQTASIKMKLESADKGNHAEIYEIGDIGSVDGSKNVFALMGGYSASINSSTSKYPAKNVAIVEGDQTQKNVKYSDDTTKDVKVAIEGYAVALTGGSVAVGYSTEDGGEQHLINAIRINVASESNIVVKAAYKAIKTDTKLVLYETPADISNWKKTIAKSSDQKELSNTVKIIDEGIQEYTFGNVPAGTYYLGFSSDGGWVSDVEIKPVSAGDNSTASKAVAASIKYDNSDILTLSGTWTDESTSSLSFSDSNGTGAVDSYTFASEPESGKLTIDKTDGDVLAGEGDYTVTLDTSSSKIIVKNGDTTIASLSYKVAGQLATPSIGQGEDIDSFKTYILGSDKTDMTDVETILSPKCFIQMTRGTGTTVSVNASHGISFNGSTSSENYVTFTVNVPSNSMGSFSLYECAYPGSTAKVVVGGITKDFSKNDITGSSDGAKTVLYEYRNTTSSPVIMTVTLNGGNNSPGYVHGVAYEVKSIPQEATVSGTISGMTSGTLIFQSGATSVEASIGTDGAYSVVLPIGNTYTVGLSGVAGYKLDGASVDLTAANAGDTVTGKDFTPVFWDASKTASVMIGSTTYTIKPGEAEGDAFTVEATGGDGTVEAAGSSKAVVWADCGGSLTSDSVSSSDNSVTASVDGRYVTLTYTNQSSNPTSYQLEVRDSSKKTDPEQDGITTTYDLTDGSVLSDMYSDKTTPKTPVANGVSIESEDGRLILTSGGSLLYYHATDHGITVNNGVSVQVKVAGDAKIVLNGSSFQEAAAVKLSSDSDTGKFYQEGDDTQSTDTITIGKANPYTKTFIYEGEATTLTFTFSGATSYIRSISVTNSEPKVEDTNVNTSAASKVPSVVDFGSSMTLSFSRVGQQITLTNSKQLVSANIKTSGLGIYAFDATKDNNTLSVDIKIDSCSSSTNNAILVGLFSKETSDENSVRAITTAVRSNINEVVQLMSKSSESVLGKNSFNGTSAISAGDVVTITISRDGTNITQTVRNKTTGSEIATKTTTYSNASVGEFDPSGEVYYGIMVANRTAVITNMTYTDAKGTVLYDQNTYYDPAGDVPEVTSVTATAAADRTKITVTWEGDKAYHDAKYVLQVKKPGATEFVDVETELTEQTYDYQVKTGESGEYTFRVCGTLGNSVSQNETNRNSWAVSNVADIKAALDTPVITLGYTSANGKVELSWTSSSQATSYKIYRKSDGDGEEYGAVLAEVTGTSYTDTAVTEGTVYYYKVAAYSDDNFSPDSDEVWTLVSDGYSGDYDEDITLLVTKRSYNTVFDGKILLEGVAGAPGTVSVIVNGVTKATANVASANGTFAFSDIQLEQGRSAVELVLEYGSELKTRKVLNYVYLTNYDVVVDGNYSGTAGAADSNGKPQYKTVAEAITAASSGNVILVRNGNYNEKLNISKSGISIIGEDSEETRIYYSVCEGNKSKDSDGSRYAITLNKGADNFTFENITLENSWEYDGSGKISNESAEALYSEAANTMLVGVRLLSYQDTIQSKNNTMYLYRCYVAGNVDFMWGQSTTVLYEDCDLVFRYNANKNSGYYTAYGPGCNVIYNSCRFTSESSCGGTKYYLGRPYNNETQITMIDCYMGSVINDDYGWATWGGKELSSDAATYEKALLYESGSYGASDSVNLNRRQLSQSTAKARLAAIDNWDAKVSALGTSYIGKCSLTANTGTVGGTYTATKYSWYEGDDSGLGTYNAEGFVTTTDVSGGGLLTESNSNYYKVSTGTEFLDALQKIYDSKGVPSVIEITADLALGSNEVDLTKYNQNVAVAHSHQPLISPVLKKSGVTKVSLKNMSNVTIFSKNGSMIKHAALDISASSNIIIRNIVFDELWEWDESTAGDYDVNDWDYMTIENGSNGIWVDHCTFYKSYDGVIDIKTSDTYATPMNVTISWCKFMPGSKDNTFFDAQMEYLYNSRFTMPYYKSLLDSGMTKEQIRLYAYGQKKTHLLGQSDEASANVNLNVTFANNYYYDSMDRMPRVRFGTAHVYNCIMDAQDLFTARASITNAAAAKHIVSNGASSTCNAKVLLENCYINGIINALNSGNGSSPSGYINAVNSLYYVNGIRYKLEAKVNNTTDSSDRTLKVTDADTFTSALPYTYALKDAATLGSTVVPYAGAGVLNLTTLQWEKTSYNTSAAVSVNATYTNDGLPTALFTDTVGDSTDSSNSSDDSSEDDEDDDNYDYDDDGSDGSDGSTSDSGSSTNGSDSSTSGSGSSTSGLGSDTTGSGSGTTGLGSNTTGSGTAGSSAADAVDTTPVGDILTADEIPGATVTQVEGVDFAQMGAMDAGTAQIIASIDANGKIQTDVDVASGTQQLSDMVQNAIANSTADNLVAYVTEDASIAAEVVNAVKSEGKTLSIGVVDADGNVKSIVTINSDELDQASSDILLKITVGVQSTSVARAATNYGIPAASYSVIDFSYSGKLPGTFKVAVNVSDKFADGTKLALCYNNESEGRLENQYQMTTVSGGYAEFAIDHCSQYVLVNMSALSTTAMTSNILSSPKTADGSHLLIWLMVMGIAFAAYFAVQASQANAKRARA